MLYSKKAFHRAPTVLWVWAMQESSIKIISNIFSFSDHEEAKVKFRMLKTKASKSQTNTSPVLNNEKLGEWGEMHQCENNKGKIYRTNN